MSCDINALEAQGPYYEVPREQLQRLPIIDTKSHQQVFIHKINNVQNNFHIKL